MKKKLLALLVALTLICSMFATVSVSAATSYNVDLSAAGGTTGFTAHGYDASTVGLMFGYGKVVDLGSINLADYKQIVITYANDPSFTAMQSGMAMTACFAIAKSNISIGNPGDNTDNSASADILAKANCTDASGTPSAWKANERTVTIDVSSVTYSGKVYLSHFNSKGHESLVTKIRLVAADTGSTPPPATYDAKINIKLMNKSIWTGDTTIIYDDTYTSQNSSKWHKSAICTYSDAENAYVVTQIIGTDVVRSGYTLAPGQILIDSCGTALTADTAAWNTVKVGSLIYLEGVDFDAGTVDAGAFAGIVNKDDVVIPDAPDLPDPPISAFQTSIDHTFIDGTKTNNQGAGGTATYVFADSYDIEQSIAFAGWAATANGVAKYQYSIDGENFYDITDATIAARDDLAGANIPYAAGHSTAGFTVTLPVTAFNDGQNALTIRLIDKQDGYVDIIKATVNADNPAGAQIPDNDEDDNINDDNNNNNDNVNNDNINNDNSENVGTDDSVAVVFVMMVAIVAMAAVVIKRRKENI